MPMLNARARTWMRANAKAVHDDWARTITVRKLATTQGSQMDELGWVATATPVYAFSYSVQAIVHPHAVMQRAHGDRHDRTYTEGGETQRVVLWAQIHADALGANPAPDLDCEVVVDGTPHHVRFCDLAANQYLLGLVSVS
jgi:hypothetical protein